MRNSVTIFFLLCFGIVAECSDGSPPSAAPKAAMVPSSRPIPSSQAILPNAAVPVGRPATLGRAPAAPVGTPGGPVSGPKALQTPVASAAAPSEWIQKLRKYSKKLTGKGQVVTQSGQETLVVQAEKGLKAFVNLSELPKMACRKESRPKRKAKWWYFDGPNPVALQITPVSFDFWRYDATLGCLASSIAFEAKYKEKGAEALLNIWVYFSGESYNFLHRIENTNLTLPKANLVKMDNEGDPKKRLSHQILLRGQPVTVQLSFLEASILRGNSRMLHVPFDASGDFGSDDDNWEYHGYAVAVFSLLKNINGELFVKVTSQYRYSGMESDDEYQHFRVYELPSQGPPFLIAERRYRDGFTGNDLLDDEIKTDTRNFRRTYKTAFGVVAHHIEKEKRVVNAKLKTNKNKTTWSYQTDDDEVEIVLF